MESHNKAKDPRILRTRQLIRDAFVELLQEYDVEKITVNRLAERATINRVTFYLHYKDIPDLMEKMADGMIEHIERILKMDSGEDGDALVHLLEHIAKNSKFYKVVLASRRTPVFTERLLKLLTELVTFTIENRGGDRVLQNAGIQKEIAVWYHSAALIGSIVSWLRKDLPYSPHFLAEQYTLLRSQTRNL